MQGHKITNACNHYYVHSLDIVIIAGAERYYFAH